MSYQAKYFCEANVFEETPLAQWERDLLTADNGNPYISCNKASTRRVVEVSLTRYGDISEEDDHFFCSKHTIEWLSQNRNTLHIIESLLYRNIEVASWLGTGHA